MRVCGDDGVHELITKIKTKDVSSGIASDIFMTEL